MSETREVSFEVPAKLVRNTVGLSIDIGGSMLKFIYRSKENLEAANNTTGTIGHLQLVSFPRKEFDQALDYIKQRCVITRQGNGEAPEVYATGVGSTQFGKTLSEKFDIRIKNINEINSFIKAFIYLASHLPRKFLFHPFDDEAIEEPLKITKSVLTLLSAAKTEENFNCFESFDVGKDLSCYDIGRIINDSDKPVANSEDIYPCLLAVCGSVFGYLRIESETRYGEIDYSSRGGLSFYAMASALTGCKTFEEFIELAMRGNPKNVDVYTEDFFVTENAVEGDNSFYVAGGSDPLSYIVSNFGKLLGAKFSEFRREDLARSWLNYAVSDLAQSLTLLCQSHRIKRLVFSGNFCNSSLVRKVITTEIIRRNLLSASIDSPAVSFDFVKPGPHLGAIGALIKAAQSRTGP